MSNFALPLLSVSDWLDVIDGGSGKITEQVTINGLPAAHKRVRLHDQRSGRLVREAWSDTAGQIEFKNIATGREWLLIAIDDDDEYASVTITDRLASADGS